MAKISINLQKGKVEKDSNIVIGIDLGTTNSLVAYVPEGKETPIAVKDKMGKNTLVPSVIHFKENSNTLVGEKAKEMLELAPERTIYSVKRLLGKSYTDITKLSHEVAYRLIENDDDTLVKIQVGNQFFTPISLSAEILKHLKTRVEEELDAKVRKVVITVPAYFNDAQRQATRDAGKLAGLDVLRIVNEPTAAALAYGIGLESEDEKRVAVYDLGGGTFDISILDIKEGIFDVLSTNGNTFLGGDDFDKVIQDYWIKSLDIIHTSLSSSDMQTLRLLAEAAKKKLSFSEEFKDSWMDHKISIDKRTFEQLIEPIVSETIASCRSALKDADISISDIDEVLMVGGSTRVPFVREKVRDFFNREVNVSLNPDEVVALGAAIQANVLAGKQKGILLLDITPLSLGIETVGGLMDVIISRNTKVPASLAREYTTSVDGQKNLKIAVFQGERDLIEHNRKLGEFILSNIPPMPAGIPKIQIQFILDADGILIVKAKELRSGVEQEIKIKSQYGISEEEMAKMLLDSIQNAQLDMEAKVLQEARNEAANIILNTERFLNQHENWLGSERIERITELLNSLKSTNKGQDKDAINSAITAINDYTSPIAHEAMDRVIKENLSGTKIE